ncbi:hypothetical protein GGR52DRAFT_523252 [Hypoxylon sp. FL1284]|nr:hypothetical protein GGR52DRAFT_523252 [Hypoxylon sp. FL1284]
MSEEFREEGIEEQPPNPGTDVVMAEGGKAARNGGGELPFPEVEESEQRVQFISYLTSPVVALVVGQGEAETVLTAHQALLIQSSFFADACAAFEVDGSPRQIDLQSEDLDAVGCFLEYLYTGDYFPKKVPGQRTLEQDPSIPPVDETGDQLLKHARVYTLAEKFGVEKLRSLASSKIHCVDSTAKGEITYARYIYQYTSKEDTTVRAPVANFWATRSHTLRAEAEEEFRMLCLEFPQFGYDVLTRVLDEKLKRERNDKLHPASGSVRKRSRHSQA